MERTKGRSFIYAVKQSLGIQKENQPREVFRKAKRIVGIFSLDRYRNQIFYGFLAWAVLWSPFFYNIAQSLHYSLKFKMEKRAYIAQLDEELKEEILQEIKKKPSK